MSWKIILSLSCIFFVGFLLNLLWENLHAPLYVHYRGGAISEYILFRAALFDALVISIFAAILSFAPFRRWRLWLMPVAGIFFAVGLELWALQTGRWEYTAWMPLAPFLNVGLSPMFQLGMTGWLALWVLDAGRWRPGKTEKK